MNKDLMEITIVESISMIPTWHKYSCIRCVACVGSCPVGALRFTNNSIIVLEDTCIGCGRCVKLCPVGAFDEREGNK